MLSSSNNNNNNNNNNINNNNIYNHHHDNEEEEEETMDTASIVNIIIKIQAFIRGYQTRIRVSLMIEDLIQELLSNQQQQQQQNVEEEMIEEVIEECIQEHDEEHDEGQHFQEEKESSTTTNVDEVDEKISKSDLQQLSMDVVAVVDTSSSTIQLQQQKQQQSSLPKDNGVEETNSHKQTFVKYPRSSGSRQVTTSVEKKSVFATNATLQQQKQRPQNISLKDRIKQAQGKENQLQQQHQQVHCCYVPKTFHQPPTTTQKDNHSDDNSNDKAAMPYSSSLSSSSSLSLNDRKKAFWKSASKASQLSSIRKLQIQTDQHNHPPIPLPKSPIREKKSAIVVMNNGRTKSSSSTTSAVTKSVLNRYNPAALAAISNGRNKGANYDKVSSTSLQSSNKKPSLPSTPPLFTTMAPTTKKEESTNKSVLERYNPHPGTKATTNNKKNSSLLNRYPVAAPMLATSSKTANTKATNGSNKSTNPIQQQQLKQQPSSPSTPKKLGFHPFGNTIVIPSSPNKMTTAQQQQPPASPKPKKLGFHPFSDAVSPRHTSNNYVVPERSSKASVNTKSKTSVTSKTSLLLASATSDSNDLFNSKPKISTMSSITERAMNNRSNFDTADAVNVMSKRKSERNVVGRYPIMESTSSIMPSSISTRSFFQKADERLSLFPRTLSDESNDTTKSQTDQYSKESKTTMTTESKSVLNRYNPISSTTTTTTNQYNNRSVEQRNVQVLQNKRPPNKLNWHPFGDQSTTCSSSNINKSSISSRTKIDNHPKIKASVDLASVLKTDSEIDQHIEQTTEPFTVVKADDTIIRPQSSTRILKEEEEDNNDHLTRQEANETLAEQNEQESILITPVSKAEDSNDEVQNNKIDPETTDETTENTPDSDNDIVMNDDGNDGNAKDITELLSSKAEKEVQAIKSNDDVVELEGTSSSLAVMAMLSDEEKIVMEDSSDQADTTNTGIDNNTNDKEEYDDNQLSDDLRNGPMTVATLNLLDQESSSNNHPIKELPAGGGIRFDDNPEVHEYENDLLQHIDRLPEWWMESVPHYILDDADDNIIIDIAYLPSWAEKE